MNRKDPQCKDKSLHASWDNSYIDKLNATIIILQQTWIQSVVGWQGVANIINLNIRQYNHKSSSMINPKHMVQLTKAIHLILGPHQAFSPLPVSACIHRGESLLNQLRPLLSYPDLLSCYLADPSRSNSNNCKMFVLLQLSKMVPLTRQTIWWNLLQFYYACSEKMEDIIIDIVVRHLAHSGHDSCTYYQPFLSCIGPGRKWSMSHLSKMLHLAGQIVHKLNLISHQQQPTLWILQQIQYTTQILLYILNSIQQLWPNYVESLTIYILKLLIIANSSSVKISQKNVQHFVWNCLQALTKVYNTNGPTNLIKLLLNLFNRSVGQPCLADADIIDLLGYVLPSQLMLRHRKHGYESEGFRILIQLLLGSRQNIRLVQDGSDIILQAYNDYIINSELKKHYTQILNDESIVEAEQQRQTHNDIQYREKYSILSQCLVFKQSQIYDMLIEKVNINMVVYLAYANTAQGKSQVIEVITVYFNSILNHSCFRNEAIIKCCLRYLYRFAVENPCLNLMGICISILNLRAIFPHFHQYCDLLLHKATPIVLTCTQQDALWEFAQVWIRNLQQNYMDVRPYSYYPILLIMQSAGDYNFVDFQVNEKRNNKNQINFPLLFQQLVQMLIEQSKYDKNKKITKEEGLENWCDNFQIFYKMCGILVKYITISNRLGMETKGKIRVDGKMVRIAQKVSGHIFKNELYSPDSAYIYVYHQVGMNQQQGIMDFLQNMMTQPFWKDLDQNQILFYSCVIIGFIIHYSDLFSFDEVYQNYLHIIRNIQQRNKISIDSHKIKEQLANFCALFEFQLPRESNFQLQETSKNMNMFIQEQKKIGKFF